jgi:hypothetical protein
MATQEAVSQDTAAAGRKDVAGRAEGTVVPLRPDSVGVGSGGDDQRGPARGIALGLFLAACLWAAIFLAIRLLR